ncbi:hypothetical protein [Dactylosporangium sp. NPDC049140]|uniref:hypothetical protein n=1 Tax=Dactylosporangium sp. NPDC049140 TaxID=3155647 RepID=UPI0033CFF2B4
MRIASMTIVLGAALLAATGCTGDETATPPAASAAAGAPAPSPSIPPSAGPSPTGDTAGGEAACTAVNADIQTTLTKVAEAEKIGPPAGFNAVSAQYSAGAAQIYSHVIDAPKAISDAGRAVADAMGVVADKYVDNSSKPDKAPLNAAITAFKSACGL